LKKFEIPILVTFGILSAGSIFYGLSIKHQKHLAKPLAVQTPNPRLEERTLISQSSPDRPAPESAITAEALPLPATDTVAEPLPTPIAAELSAGPAPTPVPDEGVATAAPTPRF
jgi:hypothetical protein